MSFNKETMCKEMRNNQNKKVGNKMT